MKGDGRTLQKSEMECDTSALEAAAYIFQFCSREQMKASDAAGDLQRMVAWANSPHDQVVATISKMPFPLQPREIVQRMLITEDEMGDLIIACDDIPEATVDFGVANNAVRASRKMLVRIEQDVNARNRCKMTLIEKISEDESKLVESLLKPRLLASTMDYMENMRMRFRRDDEIDRLDHAGTAASLTLRPHYSSTDQESIKTVTERFERYLDSEFEELESPDTFVKMSVVDLPASGGKEGTGIGRAVATIDASCEDCVAWVLNCCDRKRKEKHFLQNGNSDIRSVSGRQSHQVIVGSLCDLNIHGIRLREFISRLIWVRRDEKTLLVTVSSTDDPKTFPERGYARGSSTGLWKFQKLQEVDGAPQTRATFTQHDDLGGFGMSTKIGTDKLTLRRLNQLVSMRKQMDKSDQLNATAMKVHVGIIKRHPEVDSWGIAKGDPYTEVDNNLVKDGLSFLKKFEKAAKKKTITSHDYGVTHEIAFPKGERIAWGRSQTRVKASPEQVLAYMWIHRPRCKWRSGDEKRELLETKNDHHKVVYHRWKESVGVGLVQLDVSTRETEKPEKPGAPTEVSYLLVKAPCTHEKKPEMTRRSMGSVHSGKSKRSRGAFEALGRKVGRRRRSSAFKMLVRASISVAVHIRQVGPNECKLMYVTKIDLGGQLPAAFMREFLKQSIAESVRARDYFQEIKPLEECDITDGEALGFRLMQQQGKSKELKGEGEMATKGTGWTPRGGRKTPEGGVYQWKMQNPSMVELFEKYECLEAMVHEISQVVVKKALWGLAWRVGTGAGLNMLNVASDINVIVLYLGESGQESFGWALLMMLGMCLLLQLGAVFAQNRKNGNAFMWEALLVFTYMKPGVDAYRVATEKKMEAYQVFDIKTEQYLHRCIDLFAESIPGCSLQMLAYISLLRNNKSSGSALASIVISAVTTGYTAASISYGIDTDPEERRKNPRFYGYAPDEPRKRDIMFGSMVLNAAILLVVRSFVVVLLISADPVKCAVFGAVDFAIYVLPKIIRRDFMHQIPINGLPGIVFSFLIRLAVKVVTDFTGLVHSRHPGELGGAYWTFTITMSMVASLASCTIYNNSEAAWMENEDGERVRVVSEGSVYMMVGLMVAAWIFVFGVFVLNMVPEYRWSFLSMETGTEFAMGYWLEGADDEARGNIFSINEALWVEIRDDVQKWCLDNWWRWEEEQPAFFTYQWKCSIPDDMIPAEGLRDLVMAGGGHRRRSSIGAMFGIPSGRDSDMDSKVSTKGQEDKKEGWAWGSSMKKITAVVSPVMSPNGTPSPPSPKVRLSNPGAAGSAADRRRGRDSRASGNGGSVRETANLVSDFMRREEVAKVGTKRGGGFGVGGSPAGSPARVARGSHQGLVSGSPIGSPSLNTLRAVMGGMEKRAKTGSSRGLQDVDAFTSNFMQQASENTRIERGMGGKSNDDLTQSVRIDKKIAPMPRVEDSPEQGSKSVRFGGERNTEEAASPALRASPGSAKRVMVLDTVRPQDAVGLGLGGGGLEAFKMHASQRRVDMDEGW
ncbi:hypothetical protein TeGR_g10898 [Tetraparma gracilis]|uniref:Uncharacterized protein n=1 Tax=Tetraparma gracilis TaxID=2962635 RepID=A0ABQ6NBQ1_9STRA|nr:hypothetical protein TeGR_g10898 [Tetraparma gracilis]